MLETIQTEVSGGKTKRKRTYKLEMGCAISAAWCEQSWVWDLLMTMTYGKWNSLSRMWLVVWWVTDPQHCRVHRGCPVTSPIHILLHLPLGYDGSLHVCTRYGYEKIFYCKEKKLHNRKSKSCVLFAAYTQCQIKLLLVELSHNICYWNKFEWKIRQVLRSKEADRKDFSI